MTKGTKAFRIIISVLLALSILWGILIGGAFIEFIRDYIVVDEYDVWVAGVRVSKENKRDVLGDGTVSYNATYNALTFTDAFIEVEGAVVESKGDLRIILLGENKFICKNAEVITAIYASNNYINSDISFEGDGSLVLEIQNASFNMQAITADTLTIASNLTVITSDCSNIVNGIVCDTLLMMKTANVTVKNGAAKYSSAVRVRDNALFEDGAVMNVSAGAGSIEACRGISINGDLILGNATQLNVSIDDESVIRGECIRVTGFLELGTGAVVTASTKNNYGVECYGTISLKEGANLSASSTEGAIDVFCSGSLLNYGAIVTGEVNALGGTHNLK